MRQMISLGLLASFVSALPLGALRAEIAPSETSERPLFIFNMGSFDSPPYEVWGDNWRTRSGTSPNCENCVAYFMNYSLIGSNKFVPARSGQQLRVPVDNSPYPVTVVGLTEGENKFGSQVYVYLCDANVTRDVKTCWQPMTLTVRKLDRTAVDSFPNLPAYGDLYALVRRHGGWISVTDESERPAIVAQLEAAARSEAAQRNRQLQQAAVALAARTQAARDRDVSIENEAQVMRKTIKVGTHTNCGPVFDVRLPMIGVQTTSGMQYIELERLYGPSANCMVLNGVYQGR